MWCVCLFVCVGSRASEHHAHPQTTQAPARQAALAAGLPATVDCTTINKVCASGMKAVSLAAAAIGSGDADVIVAGGFESMSRAPHLVRGLRTGGARLGHGALEDTLLTDGLTCAHGSGHMGAIADAAAAARSLDRATLDAAALESHARAAAAAAGARDIDRPHGSEIVPVEVAGRKGGSLRVTADGAPSKLDARRLPTLPPAFGDAASGAVTTAGNASPLSDGAAALVLASSSAAALFGCRPLAHIIASADAALEPDQFPFAPAIAARKALEKAGITPSDVDLWEVNEAFALVPLVAAADLGVSTSIVNVAGSAVALGHPLGASGAAIVVRLAHELAARGKSVGVATICNGGGGASAVVLRRSAPET